MDLTIVKRHKRTLLIVSSLILLVAFAMYVFGSIVHSIFGDWAKSGVFGDTFGAANAFFSGIALFGVIFAIMLQKKELTLQRDELELTRNEVTRQADAQEKSEIALRKQYEILLISSEVALLSFLIKESNTRIKNIEARYDIDPKRTRIPINGKDAKEIEVLVREMGKHLKRLQEISTQLVQERMRK